MDNWKYFNELNDLTENFDVKSLTQVKNKRELNESGRGSHSDVKNPFTKRDLRKQDKRDDYRQSLKKQYDRYGVKNNLRRANQSDAVAKDLQDNSNIVKILSQLEEIERNSNYYTPIVSRLYRDLQYCYSEDSAKEIIDKYINKIVERYKYIKKYTNFNESYSLTEKYEVPEEDRKAFNSAREKLNNGASGNQLTKKEREVYNKYLKSKRSPGSYNEINNRFNTTLRNRDIGDDFKDWDISDIDQEMHKHSIRKSNTYSNRDRYSKDEFEDAKKMYAKAIDLLKKLKDSITDDELSTLNNNHYYSLSDIQYQGRGDEVRQNYKNLLKRNRANKEMHEGYSINDSETSTTCSFDFGHDGNYDQDAIIEGIEDLMHALGYEFTGYVDFSETRE